MTQRTTDFGPVPVTPTKRTLRAGVVAALASVVLFAILGAGVATERADASHLRDKCFPSGSETVKQTSEGRFYLRRVTPYFGGDRAVFACSYRYGRSYRLFEGDYSDPGSYSLLRISGHFAGYAVDPGCPADPPCGAGERVTSLNLRTGADRAYFEEQAHDLVLARNGSFASTASGGSSQRLVRALDSSGLRELDRGPGIAVRSLELDGTTVSWLNYGVRRTATLR